MIKVMFMIGIVVGTTIGIYLGYKLCYWGESKIYPIVFLNQNGLFWKKNNMRRDK